MIKQGTRKALRHSGTVLLVEKDMWDWDDVGNFEMILVGGDLLMLTGNVERDLVEFVVIATGKQTRTTRRWLVKNTSIAFDARDLVDSRDD